MMIRKGDCNQCGWCCQFEGIHRNVVQPPPGEEFVPATDRKFYELRGGQTLNGGRVVLYVVHAFAPCAAHDNAKKTCLDYEARPQSCIDFPSTPEQIEGTPCSFWFDEDGTAPRGGGGSPHPTPPRF